MQHYSEINGHHVLYFFIFRFLQSSCPLFCSVLSSLILQVGRGIAVPFRGKQALFLRTGITQ